METRGQGAAGLVSSLGTPMIPRIACSVTESGREGDLCAAVEIPVLAGRLSASTAAEAARPPVRTGLFPSGC